MGFDDWLMQIELSSTFGEGGVSMLTGFREGIRNAENLSDEEKVDLDNRITDVLLTLLPKNILISNGVEMNERRLPTKYDSCSVTLNLQKGYSHFNPDGKPYPFWLKDFYFPTFHPMPFGELQYPILTVLALLNCNAILYNRDGEAINHLPIPFCLGLRGSGKSTSVKQIMKQYPAKYRLWTRPNFTGAAMRDIIHEMCEPGQPSITCLDNFNPNVSIPALGRHYDLILANNKNDAVAAVSNRGHEDLPDSYVTYSYKWMTSVFDLATHKSDEAKEILRRTITLCYQASMPDEPFNAFDWSEFEDEYFSIWSNEDYLNQGYFNHLIELAQLSPKLIPYVDPAHWEITQMPIAIGCHVGIWSSIWEGIEHFAEYFRRLEGMKKSSVKDLVSQLLDQFVLTYYPAHCHHNPSLGLDPNDIPVQAVKEYLQKNGITISQSDLRNNIPRMMSEYGYTTNINNGVSFVRE